MVELQYCLCRTIVWNAYNDINLKLVKLCQYIGISLQDVSTFIMQEDNGGYRQINKSLNICAFEDYLNGQRAHLPQLANVEQYTPRVLRVLGQNAGKVNASLCLIPSPGRLSAANIST